MNELSRKVSKQDTTEQRPALLAAEQTAALMLGNGTGIEMRMPRYIGLAGPIFALGNLNYSLFMDSFDLAVSAGNYRWSALDGDPLRPYNGLFDIINGGAGDLSQFLSLINTSLPKIDYRTSGADFGVTDQSGNLLYSAPAFAKTLVNRAYKIKKVGVSITTGILGAGGSQPSAPYVRFSAKYASPKFQFSEEMIFRPKYSNVYDAFQGNGRAVYVYEDLPAEFWLSGNCAISVDFGDSLLFSADSRTFLVFLTFEVEKMVHPSQICHNL